MKILISGVVLFFSALSFASDCKDNNLRSEFDSISSEQHEAQRAILITELTKNSLRAYNIAKSKALDIEGSHFRIPKIIFSTKENIDHKSEKQIFGFSRTRKSSCAVSQIHTIDNSNKFFVKCVSSELEFPLTLLRGIVVQL